ncbi:MAG TPA: hypothetical protein VF013_03755 [Candidatus Limnocylindria bacterium]
MSTGSGLLFGAASALAFGAGDFAGGSATRRAPVLAVAGLAQLVGLAGLLVVLGLQRPALPEARVLLLGAGAGACGSFGLVALYRGLSLGSMGLVTALSGVGSVTLPVVVGAAFLGHLFSPLQALGVVAAVAAGAAASGATLQGIRADALRLALLAAVGLGMWFVLLDLAAAGGDELWVLVASRATSLVLVGSLAMARGTTQLGSTWPLVALAGLLDVTGNAAFVLSRAAIPVGTAAALSGLYPIVTMLLARIVLREALPALGLASVGLAMLGILFIALG